MANKAKLEAEREAAIDVYDSQKEKQLDSPESDSELDETVHEIESQGSQTKQRLDDDILLQDGPNTQILYELEDVGESSDRMSIDEEQRLCEDVKEASALLEETPPSQSPEASKPSNETVEATPKTRVSRKGPNKGVKAKKPPKIYEHDAPAIFILDSLNTRGHQSTFTILREYLRDEAKSKGQLDIPATKNTIVGCYPEVGRYRVLSALQSPGY